VPPNDPRRIADALARIHRDADLRGTLIERGFRVARSRTPSAYARGMFAVLDELAPKVRTWR
jgi:hypothetical protein